MRIAQLTPGTGSFYCGSCLRDNALVRELRKLGHEVVMVPLYLPLATDEEDQSLGTPVLFGGINVYLKSRSALFRWMPPFLDRLWDSPRLLKLASGRAGMTRPQDLGALTLSVLRGEEGDQARELERLAGWLGGGPGALQQLNERSFRKPFDVISLSNALLLGLARRLRERLGAPVVCTLQGEDAFLDALPEPWRTQSWQALAERAGDAAAFIAVSREYGERMRARLSLRADKIHVVHNGIDPAGYAPATPPATPVVGYLARMCPEKGLATLVDAFVILAHSGRFPGIALRVAGAMTTIDAPFVEGLREKLAQAGLADAATFSPNITRAEKQAFLAGLSVFSAPATYGESFGLYLLEAMAAGVPVVQPRHGAFPEVLEATGGGVLCAPGDPAALAEAIGALLEDPPRRLALGARGRETVLRDFTAARMAEGVAGVLRSVTQPEAARAAAESA